MKFFILSSHAHRALDPSEHRVSGGSELQMALLAKELAKAGHEVVLAGGDTGQRDKRIFEGVLTRTAGRFHTGGLADTLRAFPRILRLLLEHRPTHVVIIGWTAWLYLLARLRLLGGYKLVYICSLDTEIDGEFGRNNGWKGHLFEKGIAAADYRYAMSEHQKALFRKGGLTHGFYRNLILLRKCPRTATKSTDLLWVARCQPIKRPHLFLDLAEKLPDARCEMICPRENAGLWESVVERARKLPNVVFRESVPYAEIQENYDRAKFFVNTSEAEGFPNSMIQTGQGASGILSLDVDPDGLIGKFSAGFCARGDFDSLVRETRRLLEDPDAAEECVRGSERMVREWLDNDLNARAFLEYLQK